MLHRVDRTGKGAYSTSSARASVQAPSGLTLRCQDMSQCALDDDTRSRSLNFVHGFDRKRPSASTCSCASTCPISNHLVAENRRLRVDGDGRRCDAGRHVSDFRIYRSTFAIIRGQANAIEEFMNDRFSADGYLMMAFKLMELFGSRSLPPTPND